MEEEIKGKIEGSEDVEVVADEEAAGADAAAKVKKLRGELARREAEKREYLEGWQRAKADLINYKKEESRRFDGFLKFAAEGLIAELLPALDSFDLALQQGMTKEVEKGIVMIRSQLEDILRRRGLEVFQPLGQKFDPAIHESLGEVEADGEEGTVAEVLQPGYLLAGKLLRPARVKITKRK